MTRTKAKHKKPTYAELDKMERIKSLLEGEGSKVNTVPIAQNKVDNTPYVKYGNISVPLKKVKISTHATQRAIERLKVKDMSTANSKIKTLLRDAECIGEVKKNDKDKSILFAKDNVGIYLTTDLTVIKTVLPHYDNTDTRFVKSKISTFLQKELNKLNRLEKRKVNYLKELKLVTNIEIAELEYEIHKSKDSVFKNVAMARIEAIKQSIQEYSEELNEIKVQSKQMSKSLVAYS